MNEPRYPRFELNGVYYRIVPDNGQSQPAASKREDGSPAVESEALFSPRAGESFGDFISRSRFEFGLSQKQYAKYAKVTQAQVSRIENGRKPRYTSKQKFIDGLKAAHAVSQH